ncbi:hypothetical protein ACFPMF_15205 [Larkinella bovis]|uniref:Uncharacterized protein n=1 Tax=Larkinella bovis TaxID=683041 RepID=A0ABW0IAZ1_9BACT
MKKYLFLITLSFISHLMYAQNETINWILPAGQLKNFFYYMVSPKTGKMVYDMMRRREFRYDMNGGYIIKEINSFQNKPISIITRYLQVSNNKVVITRTIRNSSIADRREEIFNPPSILFTIPKFGEKITWISKEDGNKCTAFFKTIQEAGSEVKYLVIQSEHAYEKQKEGRIVISAYYYRYNIGLVKETLISRGTETIMWALYDPYSDAGYKNPEPQVEKKDTEEKSETLTYNKFVTRYFTVASEKAYVYRSPHRLDKSTNYIIKGSKVSSNTESENFVLTKFSGKGGEEIEAYLLKLDIKFDFDDTKPN